MPHLRAHVNIVLSVVEDCSKEIKGANDPGGKPLMNGVCESNNAVVNGSEEVEKGETEASEKAGDKKEEPEVVFIQDMGFTVKIVSPSTDAFDIQVVLYYQTHYCTLLNIQTLSYRLSG